MTQSLFALYFEFQLSENRSSDSNNMKMADNNSRKKRIVLSPGDYHVTDKHLIISTLLGSCVSACLYDQVNHVVGMNHFLLSNRRYQRKGSLVTSDAGRYGVHAMELVINRMMQLGAKRTYMKAKAFGGGSVLSSTKDSTNFFCVGEVNTRFIKEFLDNENIPLIASDFGGNTGRIIRFYANDFTVFVRKIKKSKTRRIADRDKKHWEQRVREVQEETTDIELW